RTHPIPTQLLRLSISSTDPAPTPTYTLSLHDALPISRNMTELSDAWAQHEDYQGEASFAFRDLLTGDGGILKMLIANDDIEIARSEEHTSELQSRGHLVCRLLLEKKKYSGRDALVLGG